MGPVRAAMLSITMLAVSAGLSAAQERLGWGRYVNPDFGYEIAIPTGAFEIEAEDGEASGITLLEIEGGGQIDIYGARNSEGLTPREFAAALAQTDRISEITYSRFGNSWFVLSGYYRRERDSRDDLIFYTKFMFNRDRSALSAFEASYPIDDKERYEPIIERMEDSLTSPRFAFDG